MPKDPRTLFQTKSFLPVTNITGGQYCYFGIRQGILSNISCFLKKKDCISIQVNIDGLPLFKSSNGQFWPILGLIENVENNIQHNKTPFIIGLFYSRSEPKDPNEFFKMFVDESIALFDSGIRING